MAFLFLKFWGLSFFFFNTPHKHIIIQIRQVLTRTSFAQMLFTSCNWRLIISQTAREAIFENNLGCSPRQRSELSGWVSAKRNCQWFKNWLQHDIQILQTLYFWHYWSGAQMCSPGLQLFFSEDPGRLPTLNEPWAPRQYRALHSLQALPGPPTPTDVK